METANRTVTRTESTQPQRREISDFELESLAKIFLPEIQKFYSEQDGQIKFEAWMKEQKNRCIRVGGNSGEEVKEIT